MPTAASDDGVVLGLKFDISRVKQTLDQVKNMVQGMAADSAKAVAKTDDVLEKARKNAEKWKIEPTTNGIEAAQKELDIDVYKRQKEYRRLNSRLQRRIGTLSCKHIAWPIKLGVDSPQWTDEQLAEMARENAKGITYEGRHYTQYEATQQQKALENSIRQCKDHKMGRRDRDHSCRPRSATSWMRW